MSDADAARRILADATHGTLATFCERPSGYPFASVVAYALDQRGRTVFVISDLAEHTRNLVHEPRAALLVTEDGPDPLDAGRVTVVGDMSRLAGEEADSARARFRERHPDAAYADFGDFHVHRLDPVGVRYVGGFGSMSWVPVEGFLQS